MDGVDFSLQMRITRKSFNLFLKQKSIKTKCNIETCVKMMDETSGALLTKITTQSELDIKLY